MIAYVILNINTGYNTYYAGGGHYTSDLLCAILYKRRATAKLLAKDDERVLEVEITIKGV